jgi:hypothetical protein
LYLAGFLKLDLEIVVMIQSCSSCVDVSEGGFYQGSLSGARHQISWVSCR